MYVQHTCWLRRYAPGSAPFLMTKVLFVITSQHDRFPSANSAVDRGRTLTATTMCSLPAPASPPAQLSWSSGTMLRLKLPLASAVELWSNESPMACARKPPIVRRFFLMAEILLLLPLPALAMAAPRREDRLSRLRLIDLLCALGENTRRRKPFESCVFSKAPKV